MRQRFIIRQDAFCGLLRIIEVVSQNKTEFLTIQWDGLYQNETEAVSRIETELGVKLSLSLNGTFVGPKVSK